MVKCDVVVSNFDVIVPVRLSKDQVALIDNWVLLFRKNKGSDRLFYASRGHFVRTAIIKLDQSLRSEYLK